LRFTKERLERLRRIQTKLAEKAVFKDRFRLPIRHVCGVDLAFTEQKAVVACISVDYQSQNPVEKKVHTRKLSFPYIRGFLSFREGPPIVEAIRKVKTKPEIFLINAHGMAHPAHYGCATHVGVSAGKPTIGVAGSRLCGAYQAEPQKLNEWLPLSYRGRVVGGVVKSSEGCKPIFVSPGHLVGVDSSIKIVLACLRGHRLPEPIRLAHNLANEEKRKLVGGNA